MADRLEGLVDESRYRGKEYKLIRSSGGGARGDPEDLLPPWVPSTGFRVGNYYIYLPLEDDSGDKNG